ncbi:hypothetical protein ACROYT_G000095 [Oculina patagonica]
MLASNDKQRSFIVFAGGHVRGDYISVLEPKKHIRRKLFGEEHSETPDSYLSVATTQHPVGDYNSALEFKKNALEIRRKLFGEEHPTTTCSYHSVGVTQHSFADYMSALESKKRAHISDGTCLVKDIQRQLTATIQ